MSQVRVRFAPSPTGFFHIGSARTALFNWLYARHTGGRFILRIEDTDKARNSEAFLNVIYESLRWLGMDWDEGPQVGGDYGPYRQSERGAIYAEYVERLRAAGRVYERDGALWFKLLGERYEEFDAHRKKTVTKVRGAPAIIDDAIRGRVERTEDEDFVVVRSDGSPVFHLVNVVDDITMGITHVIRGEDHLSNTSKHVELFNAFGAPLPQFAHIPLILKQQGPGKMSKRDQGALIEEYQQRGYLPQALVNFLSLLGWNPSDDREKMPLAEIIRLFDLAQVNQSNARFDDKKLAHMNMLYLLELPADDFVSRARDYFVQKSAEPGSSSEREPSFEGAAYAERQSGEAGCAASVGVLTVNQNGAASASSHEAAPTGEDAAKAAAEISRLARTALAAPEPYFREVMLLSHPKIKGVEELPTYTRYFFSEAYPIDEKVRAKVLAKGAPAARLRELIAALPNADFASDESIETALKAMADSHAQSFGAYQSVARLALTGTNAGPSITAIMRLLGRERVAERLRKFERSLAV
ncbi:glutamate--tRNA ligase [Cephaloticoccus primus]|uniref:Glutamate--tRNA ligase n=1 Tax=Cephaloticoccus primus TaxID=1548207 RepID=A0A139SMS6_9BACT|nr:glutamate--tRNA ligase family protein [Cephaloticoccus primus]KXU35794.1 glutamate--tRNA ligase [Cephaloticoccus primus]